MCSRDGDCTAGTNGRCVEQGGDLVECACTYDTCSHDTDCPTGSTCACHGSPYLAALDNECVPGNCRVDSDCGPGGYCSPAVNPESCGQLAGYYCHTPEDQCTNDNQCQVTQPGPVACTYSSMAGHWVCTQIDLCG